MRGCAFFVFGNFQLLLKILTPDDKTFKIHHWYIMLQNIDQYSKVNFQLDSNVYFVNSRQNDLLEVTEIYNIKGVLFLNNIGSLSDTSSLKTDTKNTLKRRSNLGGIVLRAVFLEETGYTVLAEENKNGFISERNIEKIPWVGLVPDIFNSLAQKLNFSYQLTQPRDGNWGAADENDDWNGMIRDLIDDEADIAPTSLAVTQARTTAADFVKPFKVEMNSFFIATQSFSYSFDILHKSFAKTTWLVLLLVILITTFITFFVAFQGNEKFLKEFSLSKSFIFVCGAYGGFSSRRWSVTPGNVSARIVFIFVMIFGCLNHWHWKASLISHLSVVENHLPFTTLEELVTSPYQVTTLGDSYYQEVWQKGHSTLSKKIWNTKFVDKERSLKKTEREVIDEALSGNSAIYLFHTTLSNLKEYKTCLLQDTTLLVNKIDLAFALPKNSPYLEVFNLAMQGMMESGELERIHRRHRTKEPTCSDPGKGNPLGFENILLVFLILVCGTCASLVICLLESCLKKKL